MDALRPEHLTWTALLGRWLNYAQASKALPNDAEGDRWRASVSPIINLQAVTFALAELVELAEDERALGRDRAAVLIEQAAGTIDQAWRGEQVPVSLFEIIDDAEAALEAAYYVGVVELVWNGVDEFVVPHLEPTAYPGSLAVMQPGTIVTRGLPLAWWVGAEPAWLVDVLSGAWRRTRPTLPHQVYRQVDDEGRITRDVIAPITDEPQAGLPLLVPLFDRGHAVGRFTLDAGQWESQQRTAMAAAIEQVWIDAAPPDDA